MDCLSKEILMYSRYVDEKLLEYLRTQKEEVKAELRTAQEKLDRLILGNKLSQDEIDSLIRKKGEK